MVEDETDKANAVKGPDEPVVEDPNDRKSRLETFKLVWNDRPWDTPKMC